MIQLQQLWDLLMKRLAERRNRLQLAMDLVNFLREADELLFWVHDRYTFVSQDDAGKDLEHVQALLKKYEEFLKVNIPLFSSFPPNKNSSR